MILVITFCALMAPDGSCDRVVELAVMTGAWSPAPCADFVSEEIRPRLISCEKFVRAAGV
ncbi:hypothetical protein [Pseudooceanicola sp. 200-1SW]|uniref:hypothetical protein n=1 Tax=Pseudooceanicola sp. 200-1SW TaxID=3425949 RepID=UPI003D7FA15B